MSEEKIEPEAQEMKSGPIAGCVIFLTILLLGCTMVSVAWYQYRQHKQAIVLITQGEKIDLGKTIAFLPAETQELLQKIENFSKRVREKKKAVLSLSTKEMNIAIYGIEKLKEFRSQMHVNSISPEGIIVESSFPMRPGFDAIRYMNGQLKMKPSIAQGSLFPIVEEVKTATGIKFPPKYKKELPVLLFNRYRNDEEIADVFHKFTSVELGSDSMTIISDPAMPIDGALPENIRKEENRALKLISVLAFMFISTVLFLLWVRKRKLKNAS